MGERLAIPLPGGAAMPAWLERPACAPAGAPAGVVLLLHEIFGLNRNMQALARWIASLGHVALVPDLWWRQAEGVALDPDAGPPAWERAFALLRGLDETAAVADLLAALAFARALPGGNGRVGSVGFCLGGRLAARLAVRSDAECHVSYYGVGLEGMLEELRGLRAPLLLHIAGRDRFGPLAAQRRIIAALAAEPRAEILLHPAADHAFARAGARSFDARTAAVAHARTEALLKRCLGP